MIVCVQSNLHHKIAATLADFQKKGHKSGNQGYKTVIFGHEKNDKLKKVLISLYLVVNSLYL